jgi:hypothetical protein
MSAELMCVVIVCMMGSRFIRRYIHDLEEQRRIFAPPRERAPLLHRVQISPFGAALSAAAARSHSAAHRQLVRAGGSLLITSAPAVTGAQAVRVIAARPSR